MATKTGSKLVQARISAAEASILERTIATLGLDSSSDALREGLRLLDIHAQETEAAQQMSELYGDQAAPLHPVTAALYEE